MVNYKFIVLVLWEEKTKDTKGILLLKTLKNTWKGKIEKRRTKRNYVA